MEVESLDNLPEEFRPAAVKDEGSGKFSVDLSLTSKVKEFRDTNVAQRREIEELSGFKEAVIQIAGVEKPEDFDIEKFREERGSLLDLKSQVEGGKLIADTSLDAAVEKRTSEMKGGYEKQKNELVKKLDEEKRRADETQQRLHTYAIEAEITRAVLSADSDVRPEALPDILNRAKSTFRVDQETLKAIPYGTDNQPIYGEDPTKVMSPKEWLGAVIEESPYFSKSSKGGGAEGGGPRQATSGAGVVPVKDYFATRKAELKAEAESNRR